MNLTIDATNIKSKIGLTPFLTEISLKKQYQTIHQGVIEYEYIEHSKSIFRNNYGFYYKFRSVGICKAFQKYYK